MFVISIVAKQTLLHRILKTKLDAKCQNILQQLHYLTVAKFQAVLQQISIVAKRLFELPLEHDRSTKIFN